MQAAIYPYNHEDSTLSAPRDSGSIIAGTGQADPTDMTYASPYCWIDERIKEAFPNTHSYPITA